MGPNFRVDTRLLNSVPSAFKNYDDVLTYSVTSSYQSLLQKLENIEPIEIDYDYIKPINDTGSTDVNYHFDNFGYYGRRYGLTPQFQNKNGSFVLDLDAGQIYFDASIPQNTYVTLRYISDGLGDNGDFDNVYVPKMAEDAVMAFILYNLSKVRQAAGGAAPLYKQEAYAKMRNAKIRLSNMKIAEMTNIFRNKAKWIKH